MGPVSQSVVSYSPIVKTEITTTSPDQHSEKAESDTNTFVVLAKVTVDNFEKLESLNCGNNAKVNEPTKVKAESDKYNYLNKVDDKVKEMQANNTIYQNRKAIELKEKERESQF